MGEVLGLGVMDHVVPFHVSTKVWSFVPLLKAPTDTHAVGDVQDTALRSLF